MEPEDKLIQERKEKLKKIQELGINPYPYSFDRTDFAAEILDKNKSLKKESATKQKVKVAGRIVGLRNMGKLAFGHISDDSGKIQVMFRKNDMKEDIFNLLKLIDVGDFIGIDGTIITTKTGEITVLAKTFEILGKTLRPLPEKWHGLKDKETRHRKRYLDLIANPEVKEIFRKRAKIIALVREFLGKKGFLEVETPVLQVLYGGTNARPFSTHINAFDMPMFLRVAPELYLKRLVVGGFEKIFEIARNFRNEGVDQWHNPEFTMIEWYEAYADYHKMMDTCEELYKHIAKGLYGSYKVPYGDNSIDLSGKWERIPMTDAIKKFCKFDVEKASFEEVKDFVIKNKVEFRGSESKGLLINAIFEKMVTPKLKGPMWIIDYPKEVSPLAKPHRSKEGFVERFECYVVGKEIGDGWSEIIDPVDQRNRFEHEQKLMREGAEERHPMDEDFIEALEYGMPVLGGIGIGIDRLVMFFTNIDSIREVIFFPIMKPEKE